MRTSLLAALAGISTLVPPHAMAGGTTPISARATTAKPPAAASPAAAAPATPAAAAPNPAGSGDAAFDTLVADYWHWYLQNHPELATIIGVRDYDDAVSDIRLDARDREAVEAKKFLDRASAIDPATLAADRRVSLGVLQRQLAGLIEANGFGERQMLFDTYSGWHQSFASLADTLPFQTRADYQSYLDRLAQYPAINRNALAITHDAVKQGYVLPCAVVGVILPTITGVIPADARQSRFYAPFLRNRPADVDATEWQVMQDQAVSLINGTLRPEYQLHADYFTQFYQPACRKTVGISALPQGAAYYAFRVREETTTSLTPDAIHQIGLKEVARIEVQMAALAKEAGFSDKAAFVRVLRSDPQYYATSPEQLLAAAARIAKEIDGQMPQLFGHLPRLPYGVRAIPAETAEGNTTAYYQPGSMAAAQAGTYFVNTSKLSQRPLWELPSLTAHEAVPGHHQQIALQQELPIPDFRRYTAGFTAFVEGWALYAEDLMGEQGLYDTPAKRMGRLSYDMWRACRLVVDTGIHAKGWTKEQAVAFMTEHTALSAANIDAEVNRYISWPGQALGYKIGELRILALRDKAKAALGPKFSLAGFNDAVLANGAIPLDVLDAQIDRWIAEQRGANGAPAR